MSEAGEEGFASQDIADGIVGPVLLGDCFALILFGILCTTFTRFYSTTWSRTPLLTRIGIAGVMILTTFVTGLYISDVWHFGTLQGGTATDLLKGTLIEALEPMFGGLIAGICEAILVLRATKLVKRDAVKWTINVVVFLLITLGVIGSIGASVWGVLYYEHPLAEFNFAPTFNQCVAIWLWANASADALITAVFVIALRRRISNFNLRTDSVLRQISLLTLRSAAYTTALAVPGAILSTVFNGNDLRTTDISYAFWIPLPACYALSLFTTLDAPSRFVHELAGPPITPHSGTFNAGTTLSGSRSNRRPPPGTRRKTWGVANPRSWSSHSVTRSSRQHHSPHSNRSNFDGVSVDVEQWINEEVPSPIEERSHEMTEVHLSDTPSHDLHLSEVESRKYAPHPSQLCPA